MSESIEKQIIQALKDADGKWRNEAIVLKNVENFSEGLEALKRLADAHIIQYRTSSYGKMTVKEYQYHESMYTRSRRSKIKLVGS